MGRKFLLFALILLFFGNSFGQAWVAQQTNLAASRGIQDINIVTDDIVWCGSYNGSGTGSTAIRDYCKTIDGGTTWVGIDPSTLPLSFSVSNQGFFHLIVQATDEASNLAVTDERFFIEASCPQERLVFMPVILKQP